MSRARFSTVLAMAVAASVAFAACGVPLDDNARAINRTTTTTTTTSTTPESNGGGVDVFFLDASGVMTRHMVEVSETSTVRGALKALLDSEVPSPLRTSIPAGTDLISVTVAGTQATVDLSSEIDDVAGDAQKAAFAQIVFTVLAFPQLQSVSFRIEGDPVEAPTDGPNRAVVTADDYDFPLNPS